MVPFADGWPAGDMDAYLVVLERRDDEMKTELGNGTRAVAILSCFQIRTLVIWIIALFVVYLTSKNKKNMCSDLGEGSRCCAGYSFVGGLFTVS